jgi:RNA polymerase sigma factor (sigma-70 family)
VTRSGFQIELQKGTHQCKTKGIHQALGKIDGGHRDPLVLYYMEDLSYKEIANVLALPLGTVQSRIARAKIQLFTG